MPINTLSCDQFIERAVAGNHQLELHASGANGDLVVRRTRIVAFVDDRLAIAMPRGLGTEMPMSWFRGIDAYLTMDGDVYRFRTSVVGLNHVVQLNAEKQITAALITRPRQLVPGQKRETYRIGLVRLDPIHVQLCELETEQPACCLLDGRRLEGRLVNLSVGGMSIKAETPFYERYPVGSTYSAMFRLPDVDKPIILPCTICNARPIHGGQATRFGLMFLRWPDPHAVQESLSNLRQFAAQQQRVEAARLRET